MQARTRDRSEYYKQYNARNHDEKVRVDRIKKRATKHGYRQKSDEEITREMRARALNEGYYE